MWNPELQCRTPTCHVPILYPAHRIDSVISGEDTFMGGMFHYPFWLWGEAFLNGYIDFSWWLEIGNLNHIPLKNNLRQIKEWILHGRHAISNNITLEHESLQDTLPYWHPIQNGDFPALPKNHTTPPQFFGCNMLPTKTPTPSMLANIWITHQTCIKSVKAIGKNCWMVPLR